MQFARLPAIAPLYLNALRNRNVDRSGVGRELLRATVAAFVPEPARLRRFRSVVEQPDDHQLPPTYPQVLAAPLHLAMFTSPAFAFNPVGLVHLANRIELRRSIAQSERIALTAGITSFTDTPRGCEIVLRTTVTDPDGDPIWHADSTVLARSDTPAGRPRRRALPRPAAATDHVASWRADARIGRSYARVSGDYNPIHLSRASARLFGFDRPIAHGMWSLARVLAALHPWPALPLEIEVAFQRPMLFPAHASLFAEPDRGGQFVLRDNKSAKAFLQGFVRTGSATVET